MTMTATNVSRRTRLARAAWAAVTFASLAACSAMPQRNAALDQARERFQSAQSQNQIATLAADELKRAGEALRTAEQANNNGDTLATVDHLAYLASQSVALAEETATSRAAQAVTAGASAERDRMRLALRTQETEAVQRQLAITQASNARTEQQLNQQLSTAQRNEARTSAELAETEAAAQVDRARLAQRNAQVDDLQSQLNQLNARVTERGVVVTLGDVLFDSGRAGLKDGSNGTLAKLADFLKRNPQRNAAIEGYTDSVGTSSSNLDLAERRASNVKGALQQMGVPADRLSTMAIGEEHPVADNSTAAGRQMNRRVEVIFSPSAGDLLMK